MPVVMPTPVHFDQQRFDYLPWASAAFADVPLDADAMTFDLISNVLSRCATPPPESLPPSPLDSAMTSPSQSRCQSPDVFLDLLLQQLDSGDYSSGQSSVTSTPYSSSPSSPMSTANNSNANNTFSMNVFSDSFSFDNNNNMFAEFATTTTSDMKHSSSNNVATLKKARRALKTGEAKPMKVKASAAGVNASYSAPYIFAMVEPSSSTLRDDLFPSSASNSSSSSSSSHKVAAPSSSKRSKSLAQASKRDSHNISERNRRNELKLSFNSLQTIVPNLINAQRAHTGTVLKETISYIHALRHEEERLLASKQAMLNQRAMLLASISA